MRLITLRSLLILFLAQAVVALAQDPPSPAAAPEQNPLSAHSRMLYSGARMILLRSAERMPEERYGFRPVDTVRTFGQIIGHIADSQYQFCSAVLGEKNPAPQIEKSRSSKADLVIALKESFAYCNKAYDGMTDAAAPQTVPFMGGDMPKLGVLQINQVHSIEHYGNLVTYMRMNGLVPPTSEPEFMRQLGK